MGKLLARHEIADEFKWKLSDIYASDQAWEEDFNTVKEQIPKLQEFRGQLNSAEQLLACLKFRDQLSETLSRIVAYAYMSKDQDNANDHYQAFADRASNLATILASNSAFIEPEILSLDQDTVMGWLEQVEDLKIYRHYLDNIFRMKPHTLPAEQEELLANASEMAQAASNIFRMFNNADLTFPMIKDENGNEVQLTHGRYISFLENPNRQVREAAFKAMYQTYGAWKNTLATTYTSAVKQALFYAKARKYNSSLEAALDEDNVKPEVYHNLIKTVHESLPIFYRYMSLRKKMLALDELHMYDVYVPMVKDVEMKVSHTEAMQMVKEGLKPLGEQYVADLSHGMESGWIDWFENTGKTSGAYSWGTYGIHPFVLMNYQENIDNMFTLAHEMGHAMHSFYSDRHQEYINSNYTIFVAEVASTLNECLVIADLLAKTTDVKEKMYLINHYLEQFRGTVFRQTMFAEFEMIVHNKIGQGEPMTAESLCSTYYDLNKLYFGDEVVIDEDIAMEWARIPHFYRPFYVYKYATGFSAAVALSQQILTEGEIAVNRYLDFLSSGGSDYPLNLLKKAGVDMTSPEPIKQAMEVFDSLLDQMEELLAK